MPVAELTFADEHVTLSVRAFSITDGISQLFEAYVTAASPSPDIDLRGIVGRPAALRLHTGDVIDQPYAVWSGVCSHAEQISVEEDGESLYTVRVVPTLWRTTQRRNYRVFQHAHCVDVVSSLLDEWGIAAALRIDEKKLPVHEYRVQFGETDFAFVSRMLEEGGVNYIIEQANKRGTESEEDPAETRERADAGAEDDEARKLPSMRLVLADRPGQSGKRRDKPLRYVGNTEDVKTIPWISKVRVGRGVRAGSFTIAGYDYRSSPDLRLLAEARAGARLEDRYEKFHYAPEAFLSEPNPEPGAERRPRDPRVDDAVSKAAAELGLERERTRQQSISFSTNQLDIAPGTVFQLVGHPRAELGVEAGLLVVNRHIEGHVDGEWQIRAEAVVATEPFRPQLVTPKPRVMGLQSAIVVGPRGEEIYTDALGRVRVQFHWDRYGKRDESSSSWIRVSQSWAGSGYGTSHIPRIGHEVLVDFFEGDPDQPVVVGRAYNNGAQPPDPLPKHKTKSSWRSSSSPGGEGYSEISIDDARGEELVYMRAQRNMRRVVVVDEEASIGGTMKTTVRKNEEHKVGGNQAIEVTGDRSVKVDGNYAVSSSSVLTQAGAATGVSVQDGKVVISNGSASIVLDGPHIYIDADANLRLSAGRETQVHGRKVSVDARPEVFINSGAYLPPEIATLPTSGRRGRGRDVDEERGGRDRDRTPDRAPRRPGGTEEAEFSGKDYLLGVVNRSLGTKLKLPKAVKLPPELDEQLERYGRIGYKGERVAGHLMDPETYRKMRTRFERRIEAEKRRLTKLGNDVHKTFEKHRGHYGELGDELKERAAEERKNLDKLGSDLGEIFSGERGNFIESCKALVDVAKEQGKHLSALRKDVKAMIDRELAYFEKAKREWQHHYNEVKDVAEDLKNLVDNPKDALLDIVLGEDKQMAEDLASFADELGMGDEVRDFFGLGGEEAAGGGGRVPGGVDAPGRTRTPRLPRGVDAARAPSRTMGPGAEPGRTAARAPRRRRPITATPKDQTSLARTGGRPRRFQPADGGPGGMGQGSTMSMGSSHGPATAARGGGASQMSPMGRAGQNGIGQNGIGQNGLGQNGLGQASTRSQSGKSLGRQFEGYGGEALAKRGGLGANDFVATVKQDGPAFLQSPGDGQLMVVPEQGARALDATTMQAAMAQAQMSGKPVSTAVADVLGQQGYTVYTREYGDYMSAFIQTAEATAAKA